MNHRIVSGIIWIGFAILMIGMGIADIVKKKSSEGASYIIIGIFILAYQFYIYKKTGRIGGLL